VSVVQFTSREPNPVHNYLPREPQAR
jgi:hypothetical protein